MKTFARFTGLIKLFTLLTFAGAWTQAQVLGPSVQEVKYAYTATFEIPADAEEQTDDERAHLHASHLFGLFATPALVKLMGVTAGVGGLGAPRSQMKIKILSSEVDGNIVRVNYSNSGKMLLHKKAARKLLAAGQITLPMPTNPYTIYDKNCTDEHYDTQGDYWYFYNVFKKGCTYLQKAPYATDVQISIKPSEYKKLQTNLRLPLLRGDNGNGSTMAIAVIHGYESNPKDKKDPGRINFDEFNEYLRKNGFAEDVLQTPRSAKLLYFTKDITLDNGKTIHVEVKHLLVETDVESRSKTFAQFFKDAVEKADVIVYGGHSGLGGNLDIKSLEDKAGAFHFNPKKKQIFYFDSCSSYSYYLEPFAAQKTKAKIDVITNGLSSYFQTSNGVLATLMDQLLSAKTDDVMWSDVLQNMENTLDGDTYLLNVGGI